LPSALIDKPMPMPVMPGLKGEFELLYFKGQPVLVNFFASWCLPCRAEHPILARIAKEQGIAVIGMKSFAAGNIFDNTDVTPAEALRYAMSLPVATVVSGIDSFDVLEQNLAIARGFTPMTEAERTDLLNRTAAAAASGNDERFKTTRDFDANEGRVAHSHALIGS
jgi:thiol-disulfide isomerase/thioredoxin